MIIFRSSTHLSCVLVLLIAIDVVVVVFILGVPLPLLLYPRGTRLQGRQLSQLQHDPNKDYLYLPILQIYVSMP
jgi:hypothetical protein